MAHYEFNDFNFKAKIHTPSITETFNCKNYGQWVISLRWEMTNLKFLLLKAIGGFKGKIIKYQKERLIVPNENGIDFIGDKLSITRIFALIPVFVKHELPQNIKRSWKQFETTVVSSFYLMKELKNNSFALICKLIFWSWIFLTKFFKMNDIAL